MDLMRDERRHFARTSEAVLFREIRRGSMLQSSSCGKSVERGRGEVGESSHDNLASIRPAPPLVAGRAEYCHDFAVEWHLCSYRHTGFRRLVVTFVLHAIGHMQSIDRDNDEITTWLVQSSYFSDLSEADMLLLFGDYKRATESDRRKGAWESEPDNPGLYIEYLNAYRSGISNRILPIC